MEIQDIPENKHDIFIFGGLGSRLAKIHFKIITLK